MKCQTIKITFTTWVGRATHRLLTNPATAKHLKYQTYQFRLIPVFLCLTINLLDSACQLKAWTLDIHPVVPLRVCFCHLHRQILSRICPQNKAYPHPIKMHRSSSSTKGSLTIFRRKLFRKKTRRRISQQTVKIKTNVISHSHLKAGLARIVRIAYFRIISRTNKAIAKKRFNKNKNVPNLQTYNIWNLSWAQLNISIQITISDQITISIQRTISGLSLFSAKWKNMVKTKSKTPSSFPICLNSLNPMSYLFCNKNLSPFLIARFLKNLQYTKIQYHTQTKLNPAISVLTTQSALSNW